MLFLYNTRMNFSHPKHDYFRNALDHEALEDRNRTLFTAKSQHPAQSMKEWKEWIKGIEGGASGVYQLSLWKPTRGMVELVSNERIEYWVVHNQKKKKLVCKKEILNIKF